MNNDNALPLPIFLSVCVEANKVDPGMRDFYLEIPLCRNGKWCLYQFRGTSVNCGTDPSAKTPILFPSRDTRAFGLIADFEDGTLQWRHLKGFGMRSNRGTTLSTSSNL